MTLFLFPISFAAVITFVLNKPGMLSNKYARIWRIRDAVLFFGSSWQNHIH